MRTVRTALRRARARRAAGDFVSALAIIEEIEEIARAGDATELHAEVEHERGSNQIGLSRTDAAIASMERAHTLAIEAGDDGIAAQTAVQLMPLYGDERHDLERGLEWGRLAEALYARMDDPDRFYLYYNYALVHWRAGALDRALEYQTLARDAIRPAVHNLGHEAKVHQMAGLLHGNRGHFELGVAELEKALRLESEHLGSEHPSVATVHNNLAAILAEAKRITDAEYHLERAVEIWDGAGSPYVALAGTAYNNLGAIQGQRSRFAEAEQSYRNALQRMGSVLEDDDVNLARPRANLAEIMEIRGDFEAAERMRRSVLDRLQEVLGPNNSHTLIVRRSLGGQLVATGQTKEGLAMLEEVVRARELKHDQDDPGHLARALLDWGRGLVIARQPKPAADVLRRAREIQSAQPENRARQAEIAAIQAAALLLQGDIERATGFANEFEVLAEELRWHEVALDAVVLARAWKTMGRDDRAAELLELARRRLPRDPIADHWRRELDGVGASVAGYETNPRSR